MWQAQIDLLSQSHRCLAPDLRGFGRSDATTGTVTMAQFADDLAELLTALGIADSVTVCGLSMGGYIALELWQRHPTRVERLILCDTRAEPDSAEVARGRDMMAGQVEQSGMGGVADSMLPNLLSPTSIADKTDMAKAIQQVIKNANPIGVAAAQRGMATRKDFRDRLSEIDVPVLLVCGEDDSITPPANMREMAKALPNAKFQQIAAAGHLAPVEQPQTVNEAIRGWLSKVPNE